MGTLAATVDTAQAMVQLDVDWSDDTTVKAITIWRVVAGVASEIRLPGPYDADGQTRLVNGIGVFYDTEMPLDVPVTYEARSTYARYFTDTFTRTVANGWGQPDAGAVDPYAVTSGPASVWSVATVPGVGTSAPDNVNNQKIIATTVGDLADIDLRIQVWQEVIQANGSSNRAHYAGPHFRYRDASNHYWAYLTLNGAAAAATSSNVWLTLEKRAGAADTRLDSFFPEWDQELLVPNWIRVRAVGSRIQVKTWRDDQPEPDEWHIDVHDSTWPSGKVGARHFIEPGATAPLSPAKWDNLSVTLPGQIATLTSAIVTVDSDGVGWLRDPLRPGNNRWLNLGPWVRCVPGDNKVVFAGLGGERFAADTGVFAQESYPRPMVLSGPRKDLTSLLSLKTRDRAARDIVQTLLAPGTPLLLQLPPVYEWDDNYLTFDDADRDRIDQDHRRPWRRHTLPFAICDAPAGPAQGVKGARWRDQCAVYTTLQQLTDNNITWQMVLRGDVGGTIEGP